MHDLLSLQTVRDSVCTPQSLASRLVGDVLEGRTRFIDRLRLYDGEKASFTVIISEALNRQGLSLGELAEICDTVPTTVSRWAKGAAPSRLARRTIVTLLCQALERRVGEMKEQLKTICK